MHQPGLNVLKMTKPTIMKNINRYIVLIFISSQINLSAQNIKGKGRYDYQVREEKGDLNNDGKTDKITVKMDTINETRPLRVDIFLSQPHGKLNLAVSSDKIIEPQYPAENKGKHNGYQIPVFLLKKEFCQYGVKLKAAILRTVLNIKMGILK